MGRPRGGLHGEMEKHIIVPVHSTELQKLEHLSPTLCLVTPFFLIEAHGAISMPVSFQRTTAAPGNKGDISAVFRDLFFSSPPCYIRLMTSEQYVVQSYSHLSSQFLQVVMLLGSA